MMADPHCFRVLFVGDNGLNESLPLTDVSALLKQHGFETDLLLERDEGRRFERKIVELNPDALVLAFDCMGQAWPLATARRLKALLPKTPLIAVGTYATLFPELLQDSAADVLCRGEAEHPLIELFTRLRAGQDYDDVENLWIKRDGALLRNPLRPLLQDLDSLPLPERELYYRRYPYLRAFSTKRVVAGRGCVNRCSYCYNAGLQDIYGCRGRKFVRRKSAGRVIAEVRDLLGRSTVRALYFIDDLFTDDKQWLLEFCEQYGRSCDVAFACNITADSVDADKVRALKRAGCRAVLMGVETGNERLRREVLNKRISDGQILEAARLFREHGLQFLTYTMLGLPGETAQDLLSSVELNRRLRPDYVRVSIAFPMPRTRMTELAVERGLVSAERLERIFRLPPKQQYTSSIYQSDPRQEALVRRVYRVFPFAVALRLRPGSVARLVRAPLPGPLLRVLHYFTMLWQEKGIFGITLRSGLRMFLHTGHPLNKTKNANNFIP